MRSSNSSSARNRLCGHRVRVNVFIEFIVFITFIPARLALRSIAGRWKVMKIKYLVNSVYPVKRIKEFQFA